MLAIDADGTIRKTKSGKTFINDPEDQEPIAGTIELLKTIAKQGHPIWIATNQGGVSAGYKTLESAIAEQKKTLDLFPMITGVCMATDYVSSAFWVITERTEKQVEGTLGIKARKPDPGMLLYLDGLYINRSKLLWMIGDSDDDAGAAEKAGWNFLHISEALKLGKLPD